MAKNHNELRLATRLAQAGSRWDAQTGAVNMPIYQAATYRHPSLGESTGFNYSRTSNPTRQELERTIADMENGVQALAFSTGMAAIDCALRLLKPGDTVVVPQDIYGGTFKILNQVASYWGLNIRWVDFENLRDTPEKALQDAQALLFETPTNPTLKTLDIPKVVDAARALFRHLLIMVDTTFLTPLSVRPLDMGCDVVIHSATKYLGGHNDLLAGVLVVKDAPLGERLTSIQNSVGAVLGAFDSWLLLRGLKTLPLRFKQQQANAEVLATWLRHVEGITQVYYPNMGAMISFETDHARRARKIVENVQLWIYAESLGGVESLITMPMVQTHADIDPEIREKLGVHDRLIRLSVGIEDVEDLITDLNQAIYM